MQMYETLNSQGMWIDEFGMSGISINGQLYDQPVCVTDSEVILLTKSSVTELCAEDFHPAMSRKPEIILIGTGHRNVFIHPRLTVELVNQGVGVESMNTDAACRTYMVLRGEGRNVWAWLWPLIN
ncbi:MAG: Mth938-like domain-containing protein [Snodgrassella sp.]|nr:Mth938-like domain-containing protein [Snodgrassella sp.]